MTSMTAGELPEPLAAKFSALAGGGFLLFAAPPERHAAIMGALPGLRRVQMWFERLGSVIVFQERNEK